jgi:hypothetical protein
MSMNKTVKSRATNKSKSKRAQSTKSKAKGLNKSPDKIKPTAKAESEKSAEVTEEESQPDPLDNIDVAVEDDIPNNTDKAIDFSA